MLMGQKLGVLDCAICTAPARAFDVVDFNKCCEEARGKRLPLSGAPLYYYRCDGCGFCFAPEMAAWPAETFAEKVYNDGYGEIDPDYREARPLGNASYLLTLFPDFTPRRHLDYGGGNGLLSRTLKKAGWNTTSYDPFVDTTVDPDALGSFDLVSAFEVFEHVPDVNALLETLAYSMRENGILLFSTLVSDGAIVPDGRLTWWYASPRNGHISLFSTASLAALADKFEFGFTSLSANLHVFSRSTLPEWARLLMPH